MVGLATPSFKEDFFERVVNVQWSDTLAVEISKGGGLDLKTSVPGLAIATISLWFRVPSSTMEVAKAEWDKIVNSSGNDKVLGGVVPLFTWGTTGDNYTVGDGEHHLKTGPSFIGVSSGFTGDASLMVRFTGHETGTVRFLADTGTGNQIFFGGVSYYAIGSAVAEDHYSGPEFDIDNMKIDADTWHHLLISFNVSGPSGTMYIAIDDHNYTATT